MISLALYLNISIAAFEVYLLRTETMTAIILMMMSMMIYLLLLPLMMMIYILSQYSQYKHNRLFVLYLIVLFTSHIYVHTDMLYIKTYTYA